MLLPRHGSVNDFRRAISACLRLSFAVVRIPGIVLDEDGIR
jgi:hypothetical protein